MEEQQDYNIGMGSQAATCQGAGEGVGVRILRSSQGRIALEFRNRMLGDGAMVRLNNTMRRHCGTAGIV